MSKKKKIRAEFRKKHESRTRPRDFTRQYQEHQYVQDDEVARGERISGKGELTRKRTVIGEMAGEAGTFSIKLAIDETTCRQGRVLCAHGLNSEVQTDDGRIYTCATRRLLKTLSTDERHVVVAGDRVVIRPESESEGFIERIEPRHGVLSRTSRGRRHVMVANVDQLLIVTSAAEPVLKPNLVDRFLVTAEYTRIEPVICINKVDLVHAADLQPLAGVYGQMGYRVLLLSATRGDGMARLRQWLSGKASVVAGQSGVGKSSLLNAVDPDLELPVREVSAENQKGRHTTTSSRLIPLSFGGYVVDTPGIRQFQLWDIIPEEVAALYRDIRPLVSLCRFPNCTHTHESPCAVKDAVADGKIDARRYESYCQIVLGDE